MPPAVVRLGHAPTSQNLFIRLSKVLSPILHPRHPLKYPEPTWAEVKVLIPRCLSKSSSAAASFLSLPRHFASAAAISAGRSRTISMHILLAKSGKLAE